MQIKPEISAFRGVFLRCLSDDFFYWDDDFFYWDDDFFYWDFFRVLCLFIVVLMVILCLLRKLRGFCA